MKKVAKTDHTDLINHIIGVTGQIGTGKSFVASLFVERGFKLFDADLEVHKLYDHDHGLIQEIGQICSHSIIQGAIDRKRLYDFMLCNDNNWQVVERLVGNKIYDLAKKYSEDHKKIVYDVPRLYESGISNLCDKVIVTTCSAATQESRVMQRAGMDMHKFQHIVSMQQRHDDARYTINTDDDISVLENRVKDIIEDVR